MNEIEMIFYPVVGKLAWGFRQTHGSCFFVEFGEPHVETIGPLPIGEGASESQILRRRRRKVALHGEWTLLVKDCSWESRAWDSFATQDTNAVDMEPSFEAMSGQYLVSARVDEATKTCTLEFDLGGSLKLWPRSGGDADLEPDEDQWRLYYKDESSVSYTNDGSIAVDPASGM
jgi:hypothetical protein